MMHGSSIMHGAIRLAVGGGLLAAGCGWMGQKDGAKMSHDVDGYGDHGAHARRGWSQRQPHPAQHGRPKAKARSV